jgi:hypothetical protein
MSWKTKMRLNRMKREGSVDFIQQFPWDLQNPQE